MRYFKFILIILIYLFKLNKYYTLLYIVWPSGSYNLVLISFVLELREIITLIIINIYFLPKVLSPKYSAKH
jgi:hypothetical protein